MYVELMCFWMDLTEIEKIHILNNFFSAVLGVLFSFAVVLLGKGDLVALL